jgi:MscS family membrane protein
MFGDIPGGVFSDIPAVLSIHFFGMEYRLIALFLFTIAASILFKTVLADLIAAVLRKLVFKNKVFIRFFGAMEQPIATLLMTAGFSLAFSFLPLSDTWKVGIDKLFYTAFNVIVFWGLVRATRMGAELLMEQGQRRGLAVATFIPLFRKIVVVILVVICVIMIIDGFGYSVTSIITALGIGGAALAFASQSTIANLYGSISIALDRPFKVGDTIKVAQTEGVVESIGLRSTLIRTDANTLVNVPNNMVATEAVDNKTAISKQRMAINIGLSYGTTHTQIEEIVVKTKELLASLDQELVPTPRQVYLSAFGENAIKIEVVCYTRSTEFERFAALRQKILLEVMKIVENSGAALAQPMQLVSKK